VLHGAMGKALVLLDWSCWHHLRGATVSSVSGRQSRKRAK